MIKPEFFDDPSVADLTPFARLFFIGLWLYADRDGCLESDMRRLKARIFPYDDVDCEALTVELHGKDMIRRYPAVEQHGWIWIRNFKKHQHPHPKEPQSLRPQLDFTEGKITRQNMVEPCKNTEGTSDPTSLRYTDTDSLKEHHEPATADSPVTKLLKHYHGAYLDKFKEKPDINGGKDGKILKALARAHSAATVAERIDRLLESTDPFIVKSGRTIGVLKACWNKLGSGGGIKPAALPIEQPNTWTRVRAELKANLNRQNFQTWFADTRLVSNGGSRLVVSVPTLLAQSWISKWYADDVRKAAECVERGLSVEFVVRA